MAIVDDLENRSGNKCEFCSSTINLELFLVSPKIEKLVENYVYACSTCFSDLKSGNS